MSHVLFPHTAPAVHDDGTATAVVLAPSQRNGGAVMLTLALPRRLRVERAAGHFVLARCGAQTELERAEQWGIYLRRPLYAAARPRPLPENENVDVWRFTARVEADPGYRWLAELQPQQPVNLTGPLGGGFAISTLTRRLLLVAAADRAWTLLPLVDDLLDRGGHVSLLLLPGAGDPPAADWRAILPLSVEIHAPDAQHVPDAQHTPGLLDETLRWADQVCIAAAPETLPGISEAVRRTRMRLESGFALALVETDLVCGYGACLACVTPLANGSLTRACVHGPVFDLLELTGK